MMLYASVQGSRARSAPLTRSRYCLPRELFYHSVAYPGELIIIYLIINKELLFKMCQKWGRGKTLSKVSANNQDYNKIASSESFGILSKVFWGPVTWSNYLSKTALGGVLGEESAHHFWAFLISVVTWGRWELKSLIHFQYCQGSELEVGTKPKRISSRRSLRQSCSQAGHREQKRSLSPLCFRTG